MTMRFPDNFLWGAALSAYQTEGNNIHSDWWQWEKENLKEPSGPACRHYELYEQDFALAETLNLKALRLSLEWSRIEPQEGRFNLEELQHYKQVIQSLRRHHLEPIITLHHFSNPLWFAQKGGWLNKRAPFYFVRYVEKAVKELAHQVHFWITLNEPLVYVYYSYILGIWPPQKSSLHKAKKALNNLIKAHLDSFRAIKRIYQQGALSSPRISIAKHLRGFIPVSRNPYWRMNAHLKDCLFNFWLLNKLAHLRALDFLGINYYTAEFLPSSLLKGEGLKNLSSLGWVIYPQALLDLLLRSRRYNLDVFILENGIATCDENLREKFILSHLKVLYEAIQRGVKILGYLYWSLMDNFEWDKGFSPRFGLIEVDYRTYARRPRPSSLRYSLICQQNQI